MATIRKVPATVLDQREAKGRALSPAQQARQKREEQFRQLLEGLKGPDDVYRVSPSDGEKPATVRLSLVRVAKQLGREQDIIVRKHDDGFLVGLVTPERQKSRRGRRPKGAASENA